MKDGHIVVAPQVFCPECSSRFLVTPIEIPSEVFEGEEVAMLPYFCAYCGCGGAAVPETN